ncbi:putative ribonuclease H-like domain-containing protein [Tanacetum coccineum]
MTFNENAKSKFIQDDIDLGQLKSYIDKRMEEDKVIDLNTDVVVSTNNSYALEKDNGSKKVSFLEKILKTREASKNKHHSLSDSEESEVEEVCMLNHISGGGSLDRLEDDLDGYDGYEAQFCDLNEQGQVFCDHYDIRLNSCRRKCSWCGGPFNGGNCRRCTNVSFRDDFVSNLDPISNDETPVFSYPPSQPQTSSLDQWHCFHYKDPLEEGERCKRCTFKWCGSGLSKGNSSIYDPNPNSFNDSQNFSYPPPQPQTYSYEQTAKLRTSTPDFLQRFKLIYKGSTIPLNNMPQISPSVAITPDLPIEEPDDSLIMGDEHLSTIPEKESDKLINSSVEDLVPIPSESEDTSGSDSVCDLLSCDDFSPINVYKEKSVTFSNPLFKSNDDFTSSDDESLSDEDVSKDNMKIYSNPLFEFDDEYISSDVNPLFDEVLEDIECKDSYDSNLDESTFLVTPLSDSNEDECFTPSDDVEFLLHRDPSTPMISVVSILEGFTDEPPLEENDDLFDLKSKTNEWKKILYDDPIDDLIFDPGGDVDEIDAFLDIDIPTNIKDGFYDSEGDVLYLESLLSDDTTPSPPPEVFLDRDPRSLRDINDLKIMVKVFDPGIHETSFSPTYEEMRRLEATGTYTDDEINCLAIGGKQRGHIPGVGRVLPARATASPKFESGGASGSGGCGDDEESADDQEDEDGDGDTPFAQQVYSWPSPSMHVQNIAPYYHSQTSPVPIYCPAQPQTAQATTLPQAFQTITSQDPSWNMDTGASSHLADNTGILTSFSNSSIYPSVFVGNGNSIPVTHTGHSFLHTSYKPLNLNHILVTPHIIKNLIYVRKFTRDNDVSVEFDAYGFSVKDYQTQKILLRCDSTGDLYPVTQQPSLQTPVVLLSLSSTTWHRRLGHPGDDVLRRLESSNLISCNKSKLSALCHACQLGAYMGVCMGILACRDATTFSDGKPASETSELNPEDVTARLEDIEVEIDTLHADTEDKELLISELQDSLAAAENEIALLQIRVADAEDRRAEDHDQIQTILAHLGL